MGTMVPVESTANTPKRDILPGAKVPGGTVVLPVASVPGGTVVLPVALGLGLEWSVVLAVALGTGHRRARLMKVRQALGYAVAKATH